MKAFLQSLAKDVYSLSLLLFKIMIPVIILVKIATELGLIKYFAMALEPFMTLVGLPPSMGLVVATTMLTNIYGGMAVFFSLAPQEGLSVAQITVLSSMMLMAHALPLEGRIAQMAGVRLPFTIALRILSAFVFGYLLHLSYSSFDLLQHSPQLLWEPEVADTSWLGWAKAEITNLGMVVIVITVLLVLLRFLKFIGVEKLLGLVLGPLLKVLGISQQATTLTIVGMTLGLSFGGGLLIKEANEGHIAARDVFLALCLLGVCHSIIEDTLLVMLLGADLSGILWGRLVFSLAVIALLARVLPEKASPRVEKWVYRQR